MQDIKGEIEEGQLRRYVKARDGIFSNRSKHCILHETSIRLYARGYRMPYLMNAIIVKVCNIA
jgi:hypothetical protein